MKRLPLTLAAIYAFAVTASAGGEDVVSTPALKCEIGPVAKRYGSTQWLVYSCDDERTLVIVSAPGNPAMPFYFTFSRPDGRYQLSGEGTGRKDVTDAALNHLKTLSERDIADIIEQTKAQRK
jgi:hypothetical protein